MPIFPPFKNTSSDIESDQQTIREKTDKYQDGKGYSCIYILLSIAVLVLCVFGLTAWLKLPMTGPTSRSNKLNCPLEICTLLPKTHQSVHAFASDHTPETISFQSPFMQTHVMTKDGISKMNPTWTPNEIIAYDVIDRCVLNENLTTGMQKAQYDKPMITCTQTENFCPIVTKGQSEKCKNWLTRVKAHTTTDTWPYLSSSTEDNEKDMCNNYDTTYASQPYRAQIVCKMMRSPRMSLAHIQNDNYNLFSTHNEMYLAICLNVIIGVFSAAMVVSISRQMIPGNKLDYFAYSDAKKKSGARVSDGLFSLVMSVQALIIVVASLGFVAKRTTETHTFEKNSLLPTGSFIITTMSGAVAVVLIACAPFYRAGYVKSDQSVDFSDISNNPANVYTTLSMERYVRFLLSRNDLCMAYCNFVTFPILVLLVYVRYEWYSIDVHIQRAFFSAVAVGALNIAEVSVMGVMYLVTEMDTNYTKRTYGGVWFRHSNLINFAVQFVFVMSKMAIFIPTILEIKQNTQWTYSKDAAEQFSGQKEGTQPLVAVMIAFFVMNHAIYIIGNVIRNLGFLDFLLTKLQFLRNVDMKLCTFLFMNMSVIIVLNYTEQ